MAISHTSTKPTRRLRRDWIWMAVLAVIVLPVLLFAAWVWITLHFTYSTGERAGYLQKISKKGWVCKTWEGQLALSNYPGTAPDIFNFTVRDDSVARQIQDDAGKRVALTYEQHKGVPGTCWGDTEYYITRVRVLGP